MPESRNRDLATSLGQAVKNNTITSTGSLAVVGLTAYDSAGLLPSSYDSNNAGTLGFAEDSDKLYIHTGQGWFNIAVINTTPIFTTSPSGSYTLATDATGYKNGTATVITLAARDSEGFPVTFSATGDTAFNNIARVDQDSANGFIFTVEPKSQDSVGEAAPANGTLTFSVTDGINTASATSTFSLLFDTSVANSENTVIFMRAQGNNVTDRNYTDESDSPHTITFSTSSSANRSRLQSFTPFAPAGYSTYFGDNPQYTTENTKFVKIRNGSRFAFGAPSGNTNDFTIELWVYPTNPGTGHSNFIFDFRGGSTSNAALDLWFNSSGALYLRRGGGGISGISGTNGKLEFLSWNHIAVVRHGTNLTFYVNGIQAGQETSSSYDFNYSASGSGDEVYLGRGIPAAGLSNDGRFVGYMNDFRIVRGSAVYTAEFTPPTVPLETIDKTIFHIFRHKAPYIYGMGGFSAHQSHSYGSQYLRSGGTDADVSPGSQGPVMSGFTPYKIPEQYSGTNFGGSTTAFAELKVAGHADFQFGSSTPFTVEFWWAPISHAGNTKGNLLKNVTSSGNGFDIHWDNDGKITIDYGTSSSLSQLIKSSYDITYSPSTKSTFHHWVHTAWCFDGSIHRLFVNGEAITTSNTSVNFNSLGDLIIGDDGFSFIMGPMRIIKGTAVYSTIYGFFPPIGIFTKTGSTYFSLKDPFSGSGGNTSVNNSVPAAHTVFLANWGTSGVFDAKGSLNYNMKAGTTYDATDAEGPVSSTGSQKYSVPSILFDKTTFDRIEMANDRFSQLTKGIFAKESVTLEGWFQWSGTAETQYNISPCLFSISSGNQQGDTANSSDVRLFARVSNGGRLRFTAHSGKVDDNSSTLNFDHTGANLLDGNWHHVAMTRNNEDKVYLFVDGVQGPHTPTTNTRFFTGSSGIGGGGYATNDGSHGTPGSSGIVYGGGWNGYISQARVTKGESRYPFLPKKETLTTSTSFQNGITVTSSNTKLLCCHHSTITTDGSSNQTITANGTTAPAVSSFAPIGGMKSAYFVGGTGNTSSLTTGTTADFAFGTGDATIELWAHFTSVADVPWLVDLSNSSNTGYLMAAQYNGKIRVYNIGGSPQYYDGNTAIVAYKWYHIALVRKSQVWSLFINGSRDTGMSWSDSQDYGNTALTIGARRGNTANDYKFKGYLSNLRVVKGQAIYDKDFTPPSEAMYG